jgi:hypothetical protein
VHFIYDFPIPVSFLCDHSFMKCCMMITLFQWVKKIRFIYATILQLQEQINCARDGKVGRSVSHGGQAHPR